MAYTKQDQAAIRKLFKKTREKTDPLVVEAQARHRDNPMAQDADMGKIIAMQNSLQFCAEVMISESLPIGEYLCIEMATRMAALFISAVPQANHALAMEWVIQKLPIMLASKVSQGKGIQTEWIEGPMQ